MKLTKHFTAFAVTLVAASANAGVVSFSTTQSDASVACAGCIAYDFSINFDGNLSSQQLWINLTSGSIYNESTFGSETAPSPALFAFFPAVEFDSFVTIGGLTSDASESVLVGGGAVDIPGAPATKTFDGTTASISWAPAPGVNVPSGANYPVARITLSADANGDLWYYGSTSGPTADFDDSGAVGNGDLSLLLDVWGRPPGPDWVNNRPATVGNDSLTELLDQWGQVADAPLLTRRSIIDGVRPFHALAAVSVPEPASMAIALLASVGGLALRGRW